MLLPNQIRDNEFTYSKGMYKADEVDAFLEEVYESYDRTFRENAELIKKLEVLANKVEEYRKDENSIGSALMAAQRAADQLTKEAQAKADELTSQAEQKAKEQLDDAAVQTDELVKAAQAQAKSIVEDANAKATELVEQAEKEAQKAKAEYPM